MSYFFSPQAEYNAKRLTQMLAPETKIAAQRDGRVLCNTDGHCHLFELDENKNIRLVDTLDLVRPENPATIVIA